MGVLYRARDTRLDRTIAIKVLRPEAVDREDRRWRFVQEAKAVLVAGDTPCSSPVTSLPARAQGRVSA